MPFINGKNVTEKEHQTYIELLGKKTNEQDIIKGKLVTNTERAEAKAINDVMALIEQIMDTEAKNKKYFAGMGFVDGMASVRKYAGGTNDIAKEAQSLIDMHTNILLEANKLLPKFKKGEIKQEDMPALIQTFIT